MLLLYIIKKLLSPIIKNEHSKKIYHLIHLKNGNLVSCSFDDRTMNLYQLLENNKYKLLSQVNVGQENNPQRIVDLENGEIGLVANNHIFFYLNINQFDEDFKIETKDIGSYYNMIPIKPGELVICVLTIKYNFLN